jgi:hypothetical protein
LVHWEGPWVYKSAYPVGQNGDLSRIVPEQ